MQPSLTETEHDETSLHPSALDRLDRHILAQLQTDGRITNQELARQVHLSPAQSNRRHRRLEQLGYIRQYEARLDAAMLGYGVTAFVQVGIERGQMRALQNFQQTISDMPQVLECYAVSGDFDYVCKVVASDLKALSDFLLGTLAQIPAVSNVKSNICLNELKCTAALPL
ncbi:AsnC family transcriptional regulator [Comamonas sp. BIGb0124]|nr:Lrp/AsnC family transcriptional regulator [Comamonas sp. BIGb0124]ROR22445.1 AsnC family transcriptional regulator [Comamonas sp. BIGb0124]